MSKDNFLQTRNIFESLFISWNILLCWRSHCWKMFICSDLTFNIEISVRIQMQDKIQINFLHDFLNFPESFILIFQLSRSASSIINIEPNSLTSYSNFFSLHETRASNEKSTTTSAKHAWCGFRVGFCLLYAKNFD